MISARDRKTLHSFIKKTTSPDTEAIYTDEWLPYKGIADHNTRHETVNHSAEEWARGSIHTNSIEGFWSLLKRGIRGVYHSVSEKYLQDYINEYGFRYNHRKDEKPMFLTVLERV